MAGTESNSPAALKASRRKRGAARKTGAQAAARDLICGAALKLFAEGGFNAVSMRTIAQELGVSAMMPYSYFPSKDHLLLELRTRGFQRLADALRIARLNGLDARDAFEAVCIAYIEFAEDEPGSYRLMFDYWALESEAVGDTEFREASVRQSGSLAELREAVIALNPACDPDIEAPVVWASLHGFASLMLTRQIGRGRAYDRMVPPMVDMLVKHIQSAD